MLLFPLLLVRPWGFCHLQAIFSSFQLGNQSWPLPRLHRLLSHCFIQTHSYFHPQLYIITIAAFPILFSFSVIALLQILCLAWMIQHFPLYIKVLIQKSVHTERSCFWIFTYSWHIFWIYIFPGYESLSYIYIILAVMGSLSYIYIIIAVMGSFIP